MQGPDRAVFYVAHIGFYVFLFNFTFLSALVQV